MIRNATREIQKEIKRTREVSHRPFSSIVGIKNRAYIDFSSVLSAIDYHVITKVDVPPHFCGTRHTSKAYSNNRQKYKTYEMPPLDRQLQEIMTAKQSAAITFLKPSSLNLSLYRTTCKYNLCIKHNSKHTIYMFLCSFVRQQ